ncbi:CRTAC1 family protein [Wenzhouxiangella marina]|uniref:CRTAC1 family protein n=1 Tax=Wenzhouxiangella marina TaxID=1579979 RepID=UPI000673AD57|nr:CRTAC1 family protein [Wenzhouxiangella marina]
MFFFLAVAPAHALEFEDRSQSAGFEPGFLANVPAGGIAVADFDRNGYPDLFVTGYFQANRLFFNQGSGSFTEDPAVNATIAGSACSSVAAADYDNDGWPDVYVGCRNQSNLLLRNLAGTGFSNEIHPAIDHAPTGVNSARTDAVAWGDLDGNGLLDLYIGVYPTSSLPDLNDPDNLDRIALQLGNGQWNRISTAFSGTQRAMLARTALTQGFSDFDFDGRPDLYVVNDKLQGNVLWRNDGAGCDGWCLTERSAQSGLARPVYGMGLAIGDVDRDGRWDFFFSSIDEQVLLRGRSTAPLFFEEDPGSALNVQVVGWGTIFADFDNDGWEDAFLAANSGSFSSTPSIDQVFRNQADGSFVSATTGSGLDIQRPTEAAARVDFDNDGRLDLVLGHWNQPVGYRLYRNITPTSGHWIGFQLDGGSEVNRDGIGARIVLDDGTGTMQMRERRSGESRGSSHDPRLHFGLGPNTMLSVQVHWPDGTLQTLEGLAVDQYHLITHPGSEGVFNDRFQAP